MTRPRAVLAALLACALHAGAQPGAASAEGARRPAPAGELAPLRAFRAFTRQNSPGLPQNSVAAMVQDGEGVLWLGTLDGLAWYDGRRMTDAGSLPGLPPFGAVYAVARRNLGGVYVGGTSGLHARDAHGAWRFLGDGRAIAAVVETTPGVIWVVDQQGGLNRVTDDDGVVWDVVPLPDGSGPALAVAAASSEAVWVAAHSSIVRVDGSAVRVAATVPAGQRITALAVSAAGTPWAGFSDGTIAIVQSGRFGAAEPACEPGVAVTAVVEDWRRRLWASCADGRLSVGVPSGPRELWGAEEGLRVGTRINALAVDRHGSLWIGHNGIGASQLIDERWRHRAHWSGTERQIPGEGVFGITPTGEGGALIAVFNRGIWRWDGRQVHELGREAGLVENLRCAVSPEPAVVWAGGRFGIYESRRGGRFRRVLTVPTGFVTGIHQAPDGVWYALTSVAGLWTYREGTWAPEAGLNAQLPHQNVRAIAWVGGETWLATAAGLVVVRDGRVRALRAPGEPGSFLGNALLVLPGGEVWAAGMGGIWVRQQDVWGLRTAADGLPGRTVYSLARSPDGTVWAGGSAGVGAYKGGAWTHHTRGTGLIEDECTLEGLGVLRDGTVLVGTMGSLAVFTPSTPLPPPAPLTLSWRQTPPAGPDGIVRLPKGERRLRLSWSAPWLAGDPVEYRTRVTPGPREDGAPSDRTSLTLERLDPGRLTVEVQARIGGPAPGTWTPPLTVAVEVAPYLYETWWARLAGFFLLAGLVPLAVRFRTRQLERRQRELQHAVDAAVAEVKTITGLIPVCASCKRIRDDRGSWNQLEAYLDTHSSAQVSHGICPQCMSRLYPEFSEEPERHD